MMDFIQNMMMSAPTSTAGKAKIKIWTDCFLKMYQSELNELSKMSGGKNINKIEWGFIVEMYFNDYPKIPVYSDV